VNGFVRWPALRLLRSFSLPDDEMRAVAPCKNRGERPFFIGTIEGFFGRKGLHFPLPLCSIKSKNGSRDMGRSVFSHFRPLSRIVPRFLPGLRKERCLSISLMPLIGESGSPNETSPVWKGEQLTMPFYHFRRVWTPLQWIGIRFFRDDEGNLWIKAWNRRRRLIRTAGRGG